MDVTSGSLASGMLYVIAGYRGRAGEEVLRHDLPGPDPRTFIKVGLDRYETTQRGPFTSTGSVRYRSGKIRFKSLIFGRSL